MAKNMSASKHSLQVYFFYSENDLPVISALSERLRWDDVDVRLIEFSALEKPTEDSNNNQQRLEKKQKIQDAIQNADILLFGLSEGLSEQVSLSAEWKFVFDAAAGKTNGSISILTVRLEECSVPQSLETWNSIDLFEVDGYEKLMLAMKFHADMEAIELGNSAGWKTRFVYPDTGPKTSEVNTRRSPLGWIVSLGIILIAAVYLFRTLNDPFSRTQFIPVEILAENATQNIQSAATNRSGTKTADLLSISIPRTQTAEYLTALPLTKTKTDFEAHITHTATITPTITLTPTHTLTVVSNPGQIVSIGDVSMVLVPAGSFPMGDDGIEDASPETSVDLKPFYIDQYEVSNGSYRQCVLAEACQPPAIVDSQTRPNYYGLAAFANYPVINVDWNMARTYCEWRGARLPTEAEWEKAARGTDTRAYPWGDVLLCPFANYSPTDGACVGDTQLVDRYGAGGSPFNVYNMAGNVAEWVSSLYLPYPNDISGDREDPASSGTRVVRGGSWASSEDELLTYYRISLNPELVSLHGNDLGFRCARNSN